MQTMQKMRLTTPEFTISFPALAEKRLDYSKKHMEFSLTALVKKGTQEHKQWVELKTRVANTAKEWFGKDAHRIAFNLTDCDEPNANNVIPSEKDSSLAGMVKIRFKNRQIGQIITVDSNKELIDPKDIKYGDVCKAALEVQQYSAGKSFTAGVTVKLMAVQRVKERSVSEINEEDLDIENFF